MYRLFTDGGARGNPGKAACGCILFDSEFKLVDFNAKFLGIQTNNLAEYEGILLGLKLAKKNGVKSVQCFLDSELIVKQLNGKYKVKSPNIKPSFKKTKTYLSHFESISFHHVRRDQNKFADKLGNIVMDAVD